MRAVASIAFRVEGSHRGGYYGERRNIRRPTPACHVSPLRAFGSPTLSALVTYGNSVTFDVRGSVFAITLHNFPETARWQTGQEVAAK
jgi:hypothetical protein